MDIEQQIAAHIASQPEPKRSEMQLLHDRILEIAPQHKQWFEDGINSEGKAVANPNIGYGSYTIKYADGKTRDFFRVGISANKAGISVYILGLSDKNYLINTYGPTLGKAKVTGYCIAFKSLKDINIDVLVEAVRYRLELA